MLFGQEVTRRLAKPGAYNPLNDSYTAIHEDNTATVDSMIMEPFVEGESYGIPGPVIITSGTKSTPAAGHHYYMLKTSEDEDEDIQDVSYVGLIKIVEGTRDSEGNTRAHYVIWEPRFYWFSPIPIGWARGESPIDRFKLLLKNRERGSLVTYRIDSTNYHPTLYSLSVDHPLIMKPNQVKALQFILGVYRETQRGTFLLSGTRGTGKTTTALQIKRELEDEYPNTSATLIPNFSPSQSAVDISRLALRDISPTCPYIIVVNECEQHMEIAASSPVDKSLHGDRRFTHSADRTTYHDLLDTLAATKYLIVILATEKPIEELWSNPQYRSFMRQGRIHGLVRMTHDETTVELNQLRDDKSLETHKKRE